MEIETKKDNLDVSSIPEWNPKTDLKTYVRKFGGISMIISGNRSSGKSTLLKYLLVSRECNFISEFHNVIIFSKTLSNGFYEEFINTKLLFKEFDPEPIKLLNETFEKYKNQGKTYRYLVILDDIIDQKTKYIDGIGDLFYCGRHFGASVIFLTQKLSCINTGWIANTYFFIILQSGSRLEKKFVNDRLVIDALYENHEDKKKADIEHMGYWFLSKICQNYNSIVIVPSGHQKIYQFLAKPVKKGGHQVLKSL